MKGTLLFVARETVCLFVTAYFLFFEWSSTVFGHPPPQKKTLLDDFIKQGVGDAQTYFL